jgi:hypothetical protein
MSQDKQNVAVIITVYRQDGLGVCTYVILEKYEEIDLASISSKSGLTSEEPLFFFYRYKQGHKQKIEMNSVYLACNECLVKVCDISLYNFFEIDHDRNIKIIKQKLTKRFTKSGIEFL